MITWLSTKSPIRMLDISISREMEQHLRENPGVDPALLGMDLGLCAGHIRAKQRRLGLRKCAPTSKKRAAAL